MKIALYHGYELGGSGSNEYTRYLAQALAALGHQVVLICAEPDPDSYPFIDRAVAYDARGQPTELFRRAAAQPARITLHQLPRTTVYPVFLTDKQRPGHVKAFPELSDEELAEYHDAMVAVLARALQDDRPDVLHANHLVYQPVVAAEVCTAAGVPFYIVPHGSAIEYTVKADPRFLELARRGLRACSGVAWIAREVRERVLALFPELAPDIELKSEMIGVGTDTSLFSPLDIAQRPEAIAELRALHRRGGKTAAQRLELHQELAQGDVEAVRRYWDAYDQKLEDDDLPARLDDIPLDGDLLLFVGAMTYGKGIQSLIAAMPAVLARRPSAHLLLVGSGTYREVLEGLTWSLVAQDLRLFDEIVARGRDLERAAMSGPLEDLQAYAGTEDNRRLLKEHGPQLRRHVHFLGRLDHPRLRCIFPCCRLAIFPSVIKEASPLVFMEALANGVLPVGAYHSGLRDGLDDLRRHLPDEIWQRMKLETAPERRVSSIVASVTGLLDELDRRDLTGQLRQLAVERYDWRAVAEGLAALARRMLD